MCSSGRHVVPRSARGRSRFVALFLAVLLAAAGRSARAETSFSFYLGNAETIEGEVELEIGDGTDLDFDDVEWLDESFDNPLYYGFRLTHFFERRPEWGVALDFFHAKVYADEDDVVHVRGRRGGVSVDRFERIGDTFGELNLSHGLNFLTLNAVRRWELDGNGRLLSRLRPYVGAGAGVAIPHVEVEIGGEEVSEYQIGGLAFQAFAGADFRLSERWSFFGEYKFSFADLDLDVPGGSLETETETHHVVFGVSFRL